MPLINLSGDTHLVYWRMYLGGSGRECEDYRVTKLCQINDALSSLSGKLNTTLGVLRRKIRMRVES